jgi:hypothetical protein
MLISREWVSNAVPIESWLHGVVGYADGGATCKAKCHAVRIEYDNDSRTANVDLTFNLRPGRTEGELRITMSDAPRSLRQALRGAWETIRERAQVSPWVTIGRGQNYPGMPITGIIYLLGQSDPGNVDIWIDPVPAEVVRAFLDAQMAERLSCADDMERSG